jgi:hypothetical protein
MAWFLFRRHASSGRALGAGHVSKVLGPISHFAGDPRSAV